MTRLHGSALGLAMLVLLVSPGPLHAQNGLPYCAEAGLDWGLGPTLLSAPGGRELGAKGSLEGCFTGHAQLVPVDSAGLKDGFPTSYSVLLETDFLVASRDLHVPAANSVRFSASWSVSLSRPELKAPRDWPIDRMDEWDGGGYNRGFLDIGAAAAYESSADWKEGSLLLDAQVRYANNDPVWGHLLPSVVAYVGAVKPVSSDARDTLNLPLAAYGRMGVRGYWNTQLSNTNPFFSHVRLQGDVGVYRTFGLEQALEDAGWKQGDYASVSLRYAKRIALVYGLGLRSLYVRYSVGKWPTASGSDNAFSSGMLFNVGG